MCVCVFVCVRVCVCVWCVCVCLCVGVCVCVCLGEHIHIERDWSKRLHHQPGDPGDHHVGPHGRWCGVPFGSDLPSMMLRFSICAPCVLLLMDHERGLERE